MMKSCVSLFAFLAVALLSVVVPVTAQNDLSALVSALNQLDEESLQRLVDSVSTEGKGNKKKGKNGKKKAKAAEEAAAAEAEAAAAEAEAPRVQITSRMADLDGCGAFLSCTSCASNGSCYWNPNSGCETGNGRQSMCTGNQMVPGETRLQCQEFSNCKQCTTNNGCIWYKGQCTYSRGDGCLRDPANCVNYESQCPVTNNAMIPVASTGYTTTSYSQPTTTSYSQPTATQYTPATSYAPQTTQTTQYTQYSQPQTTQYTQYSQPQTTQYTQPQTSYPTSYAQSQSTTQYVQQPTTSYNQPSINYVGQSSIPTVSYSGGVTQGVSSTTDVNMLTQQLEELTQQLELMQHQQGQQQVSTYPANTQYSVSGVTSYPSYNTQTQQYSQYGTPISQGPTQAEIQRQQQLEAQIAQLEQQMYQQQMLAQQQMQMQQMQIMQQQQVLSDPNRLAYEQQKQQLAMQQQQEYTMRQQELDAMLMQEFQVMQMQMVGEYLQPDQQTYLASLTPEQGQTYIRNILPSLPMYIQQQLQQREQQLTVQLNAKRETELSILSQQHQSALSAIYPTRPTTGNIYPTRPTTGNIYPTKPTTGSIYPTRPITSNVYPTTGIYPTRPMTGNIYPTKPAMMANNPWGVSTGFNTGFNNNMNVVPVAGNIYPTKPVISTGMTNNVYPTRDPVTGGSAVAVTSANGVTTIYPTKPIQQQQPVNPWANNMWGMQQQQPSAVNSIYQTQPSAVSTIYPTQNGGLNNGQHVVVADNNGSGSSTVYSKGAITGTIYVTKTPGRTTPQAQPQQQVYTSQGSLSGKIYTTRVTNGQSVTTVSNSAPQQQQTVFGNSGVVNNYDGTQTVYETGSLTGKVYATRVPAATNTVNQVYSSTMNSLPQPVQTVFTASSSPVTSSSSSLGGLMGLSLGSTSVLSTGSVYGRRSAPDNIVTSPVTGKVYATRLDNAGNIASVNLIGGR